MRGLAAKGVVVKQHGNVLWPENRDDEPLQRRMAANMGAKKRIAQAVARLIKDGESLLIDSGSTTMYVAEALRGHRNLTVATISAPIAQMLAPGDGNRVYLAGGEVRAGRLRRLWSGLPRLPAAVQRRDRDHLDRRPEPRVRCDGPPHVRGRGLPHVGGARPARDRRRRPQQVQRQAP